MKSPSHTKLLCLAAIFIALHIVLTNILAIQTPFIRIDFGFLAVAIFSMLFGPLKGGIMAAVADVIGCLLFFPGLYFPGFTLSAFLSGVIYGYFLYDQKITVRKIAMASFCIFLLIDLTLNTLWLSLLYHKAAQLFLLGRFIKCAILLPIQGAMIYTIYKPLRRLNIA